MRAQEMKVPDTPETLHLAPEPSDRFPAAWYPKVGDGTNVGLAPVLDEPYTAVVETVTVSMLPSGKPGQRVELGFKARDRFGRTRSETVSSGMMLSGNDVRIKTVLVSDPVSHCQFHWQESTTDFVLPTEMRVAFVTCGPRTIRYKDLNLQERIFNTPDGTVQRGDTTITTEHLAPVPLDGITVQRVRVTHSRRDEQGEEERGTKETWYSPELKEVIRMGDEGSAYEGMKDIRRVDPEPKLFYPPGGYRIEVQAGR